MKGTIRIFVGLLLVMGSVGGIEAETATLLEGTLWAFAGLAIMASGAFAANRELN